MRYRFLCVLLILLSNFLLVFSKDDYQLHVELNNNINNTANLYELNISLSNPIGVQAIDILLSFDGNFIKFTDSDNVNLNFLNINKSLAPIVLINEIDYTNKRIHLVMTWETIDFSDDISISNALFCIKTNKALEITPLHSYIVKNMKVKPIDTKVLTLKSRIHNRKLIRANELIDTSLVLDDSFNKIDSNYNVVADNLYFNLFPVDFMLNSLIKMSEDGPLKQTDFVTKHNFNAYLNKLLFSYKTYKIYVNKINNDSSKQYISRFQAINYINNILNVSKLNTGDTYKCLNYYNDYNSIPIIQQPIIAAFVSSGYIVGYDDNSLKMNNLISREELLSILQRIVLSNY